MWLYYKYLTNICHKLCVLASFGKFSSVSHLELVIFQLLLWWVDIKSGRSSTLQLVKVHRNIPRELLKTHNRILSAFCNFFVLLFQIFPPNLCFRYKWSRLVPQSQRSESASGSLLELKWMSGLLNPFLWTLPSYLV